MLSGNNPKSAAMAQSGAWQAPPLTFWERTKNYSSTAYSKALKPGFEKAYTVVDKLGAPINRLSNKVGSEAFWPTSIDKESEKCARILRAFCKDGFYDDITAEEAQKAADERRDPTLNIPQGTQRNVVRIPAKVIQNAVGLAIFTSIRTGWVLGGNGGAGVVVARHPETGEWSPPSGIMTQNLTFGFLAGIDIFDTVLVINNYRALEAFTRLRCTLGTELGVAAGPVGAGSDLNIEFHKKPAPVWSYVKSRGLYAGIALAGNAVIERADENAKFYGYQVSAADILAGKVRHPPEREYKVLADTLRAAQGEPVDESLLPAGDSPGDLDIDFSQGSFGIPAIDDDDPYGVKALEAEGLQIREAGTHYRPSADIFEFNPAPTSPIYSAYRRSADVGSLKRRTDSWRNSSLSVNSVTRATQTEDGHTRTAKHQSSQPSLLRNTSSDAAISASPTGTESVDEHNPIHQASLEEQEHEDDEEDEVSDIDSDAEIVTAVSTVARPRVVQVLKPLPPALPPRNPGRAAPPSPFFTVKLKTNQNIPEGKLALRTSLDNWTVDRKGELRDDVWHFKLDTAQFSDDFECKFVILPDRWMHDPNLLVACPAPSEYITFTDSRVIFPDATENDTSISNKGLETVFLGKQNSTPSVRSDIDDDASFVSVPPTPNEKEKPNGL